tara:strand:- start:5741 stop:7312 length:1572 start_codon:yes stop_codon:yes gene_type:complete
MTFTLPFKEPNLLSGGIFKTDIFSRKRLIKVKKKINHSRKEFFVTDLNEAYAIKEKISVKDINPHYLANLIAVNPSKNIAPYKDIYYLPASSFITLENSKVNNIVRYDPFKNGISIKNHNELFSFFKENFLKNLKKIINENKEPIACEHSSGLDSNIIISSLIKGIGISPDQIYTWSNVSSGEEYFVKKFCSEYKIPESNRYHIKVPSGFNEFIFHDKEIIKRFGAPTICNFDLRSIKDLSDSGCNLFFSGLGGDQALTSFAGNIEIDLIKNIRIKEFIKWNGGLRGSVKSLLFNLVGLSSLGIANKLIKSFREKIYYHNNYNSLLVNHLTEHSYNLFGKYLKKDKFININFITQKKWILNNILNDRIYIRAFEEANLSQSIGMKKEFPMLDENLIETYLNHCSMIFADKKNNQRFIFRKSFSDFLPQELVINPDKERISHIEDIEKFWQDVKIWNRQILQGNINFVLQQENLNQFFEVKKLCEKASKILELSDVSHYLLFSYNQSFATLRKISNWFQLITDS